MVFVRYIHDGKILDDFLFCRGLISRTTTHDVLKVVSDFFTAEGLSWENVVGIVVDFHLYLYIQNLRRPMANETHF